MTAIRKVTKHWTQRDGTTIRICDMSDRHLLNTIAMLRRAHQRELAAAWSMLSTVTAEMATYYLEQDIERMEDSLSDHPLHDDLCAEAERRGLTIE
jgi:hypothetical protein